MQRFQALQIGFFCSSSAFHSKSGNVCSEFTVDPITIIWHSLSEMLNIAQNMFET